MQRCKLCRHPDTRHREIAHRVRCDVGMSMTREGMPIRRCGCSEFIADSRRYKTWIPIIALTRAEGKSANFATMYGATL